MKEHLGLIIGIFVVCLSAAFMSGRGYERLKQVKETLVIARTWTIEDVPRKCLELTVAAKGRVYSQKYSGEQSGEVFTFTDVEEMSCSYMER